MFTSQVPLDLGCFARVPAKHEDSCPDNNHNLLLSARQHHSISAVGSKHKDTTSETYSRTVETLALHLMLALELLTSGTNKKDGTASKTYSRTDLALSGLSPFAPTDVPECGLTSSQTRRISDHRASFSILWK